MSIKPQVTSQLPPTRPEWLHAVKDKVWAVRNVIPWWGAPLHGTQRVRPFFIIGSGRSGNTLMRRILIANKSLFIPPETYVLCSAIRAFRRCRGLPWPDIVRQVLAWFVTHRDYVMHKTGDLSELTAQLIKLNQEERNLAMLFDYYYRWLGTVQGRGSVRWGDKTPLNTASLDRLHQVFPQAQYIHMLRDGYDVAYSYRQAGLYGTLEEAASRWLDSVRLAATFELKHRDQVITVCYEKLVSDPNTQVRRVCDFLGIEYQSDMLELKKQQIKEMGDVSYYSHHENVFKDISSKNVGKAQKELTIIELQSLERIIGTEMLSQGYPRKGVNKIT